MFYLNGGRQFECRTDSDGGFTVFFFRNLLLFHVSSLSSLILCELGKMNFALCTLPHPFCKVQSQNIFPENSNAFRLLRNVILSRFVSQYLGKLLLPFVYDFLPRRLSLL